MTVPSNLIATRVTELPVYGGTSNTGTILYIYGGRTYQVNLAQLIGSIDDGDKGDITVSASGETWLIDAGVVTNTKLADVATATLKGRVTAGTGVPEDLTGTQVTTLLDTVTSALKGLAPPSGGGTTNYLRADGTWASPPGSGLTDGDKGDISVTASGATWTIDAGAVTTTKMGGDVTAAGKALLDDANASAQRTTLGLGTAAVAASSDFVPAFTSQSANLMFASPNGSAGVPSFRALAVADVPTLDQSTTGSAATLTTGRTLGITGDLVWTSPSFNGSGNVTAAGTIQSGVVTNAKLADVATATLKGRTTAGTGVPEDLTATQATAILNTVTSALNGLAPASGGGTANFLRADGTWAAPTGWTYVVLSAEFNTTSATAVDVTGLAFTPAANTKYEFEAVLLMLTTTTTVGPRPGLAWPTGLNDSVAFLSMPTSATTDAMVFGNESATILSAVGGLPTTADAYPARLQGVVVAGAAPSGSVKIQLASETGGTTVAMRPGSFIKYRVLS